MTGHSYWWWDDCFGLHVCECGKSFEYGCDWAEHVHLERSK